MHAFKFSLLAALAWSFCALIIRTPNVRPLCDTCVLKELRSDSINAAKFYLILRSLNLKFSLQNLICTGVLTQIALKAPSYKLSRPLKF